MKFNIPVETLIEATRKCYPHWEKANMMALEGGYYQYDMCAADFYKNHRFLKDITHQSGVTVSLCSKDYQDLMYILNNVL